MAGVEPTPTPKRGPGRPPGSRNKVWKNQASIARRSMRGTPTPASRGHEDIEDNHPSPTLVASEAEHQTVLDENQELKAKCAELEAALAQTLEESAAQARNAADVINDDKSQIEELQQSLRDSEDQIDQLKVDKMAYLLRATQAEEREAQLKERIEILQCGQPWQPSGAASSRRDPLPPGNEDPQPGPSRTAAPIRDVATASGSSQQASGATSRPLGRALPSGRNAWPRGDEELLVRLIALIGPRDRGPRYSKIERVWREEYPDRIPRDQGQLKDKAWNIKASILWNGLPLPPKFDFVGIKAKVREDLIVAGINPDRKERDVDADFKPTNVRLF